MVVTNAGDSEEVGPGGALEWLLRVGDMCRECRVVKDDVTVKEVKLLVVDARGLVGYLPCPRCPPPSLSLFISLH